MDGLSNSKKIAKNTLFLYFRMLLITIVSLYTVRVVINTLGVVDYGIYSAVGGVVLIMTFISQTISSASQRFITYEIGMGADENRLRKVFSTLMIVYVIIALIIVLILETAGLWFLFNKMVIPPDRLTAASWVFHFSILTFVVSIISTPYNAIIIAYEDMKYFAMVSIVESILKLVIVYMLLLFNTDKLILYAILVFLVTCLIRLIYGRICTIKYPVFKFTPCVDKGLIKSIFSYSSWTMFGTMAGAANNQGTSMLLNMFFGPIANAADSVGRQVGNALQLFVNNLFVAVRPPLIKGYVNRQLDYTLTLFYASSKFSFYLLIILLFPLMINTNFILVKWLGNVSEYTVSFTRLILVYIVLISLSTPITILAQAANKVRLYHGIVDSFTLLCFPLAYLFFKNGYGAESIYWVIISIFALAHFMRIIIFKQIIDFNLWDFIKRLILPILFVLILSVCLIFYSLSFFDLETWTGFILSSIVSCLICLFTIAFVGINKAERNYIINYLKKKYSHVKSHNC